MIFSFLLISSFSVAEPKERFWISFLDPFSEKYIMQIDAMGNIHIPPFKVLGIPLRSGSVTALSFNGNASLNLWFLNDKLYRATIDKKTLRASRFIRTNLKPASLTSPSLEVTNRKVNNFVAFAVETSEGIQIAACPTNEFGRVIGKRRIISPPLSSSCDSRCRGGMTANGRLSYWMHENQSNERRIDFFIRPLGAMSYPLRKPVLIDSIVKRSSRGTSLFQSADSTGFLPANKRYLVYVESDTRKSGAHIDHLLLQPIDAQTGREIGEVTILHRAESIGGNVKIDPLGRFVLFGQLDQRLGYLALDSTGRPSGRPKALTDIGSFGIDLLREIIE